METKYTERQLEVLREFTDDISSIRAIPYGDIHNDKPFDPFNPMDYIILFFKSFGVGYANKEEPIIKLQEKYHVVYLTDDPLNLHLIPKSA